MKIVFFGTPDFAVASLKAVIDAGFDVVAVVTAPDKPAGRGLTLHATPVKVFAVEKHIPVLQPVKLKDPEFLEQLRSYAADLHVVVAFRMLPEAVWNMPSLGTINVHGSLLPQFRGAAPINYAIISGAQETGVTTFKLKHEIDTGNMLMRRSTPILPSDNAGTLHDRLMVMGAELLAETLKALEAGTLKEEPQTEHVDNLLHAPKIFKEDTRIDWNKPATTVWNFIRGLSPYPAAFTDINGKSLKIYDAQVASPNDGTVPGTRKIEGSKLFFAAKDKWIEVFNVQYEGKKRMDTAAFLNGFRNEA